MYDVQHPTSPRRRLPRRALAAAVSAGIALGTTGLAVSPAAAASPTCNNYIELRRDYHWWERPTYGRSVDCVLRPGSAGAPVLILQRTLIECYGQTITEQGYGSQTTQAVRNVQTVYRLTQDGVYGPVTGGKMKWWGISSVRNVGAFPNCIPPK